MTAQSGLVIVDKPAGWTSHGVVGRIRRLAGTRKVGHAGTLDPMATGVLVVGVRQATRLLGHLALTQKEYLGTIRLGQATSTDDAEGEIMAETPADGLSGESVRTAAAALTGPIQQVPPGISAIKVDGQRAYRLTRAGAAPDLPARPVTVSALDILALRREGGVLDVDVAVTCSSGTYIRAIARDLGAALAVGGHLTALRRTRVGPYRADAAATLDELAADLRVIPLATAAADAFPRLDLSADQARLVAHGGRLPCPAVRGSGPEVTGPGPERPDGPAPEAAGREAAGREAADRPVAAFGPDGELIALLTPRAGQYRSLAVFVG